MPAVGDREIRGRIVQVLSRRESEGRSEMWLVVRLQDEEGQSHVVEGIFTQADVDAPAITVRGTFRRDRKGKRRFSASWVWRGQLAGWAEAPPTQGLVNFLAEGGLKGFVTGFPMGPVRARQMGEALGDRMWEALTGNAELLAQHVRGMMNAAEIQAAIAEIGHSRVNALARLMVLNLSLARANRILDHLGLTAIEQIRQDPYVMSSVPGIGFATADAIARERMGVELGDERRLRAMVRSVLSEAAVSGSTSIPRDQLLAQVKALAEKGGFDAIPEEILEFAIHTGAVAEDGTDIYLPGLLHNERHLASAVAKLALAPARRLEITEEIAKVLEDLTEEQVQAVVNALTHRVSIITGPPGSGKTHIIRAIHRVAEILGRPVTLTASTGKAAERINESMGEGDGIRARTTHSVIGPYNRPKNPPPGILVADEASMLDLEVSSRLAAGAAESDGQTSLVLIGDEEQLESVMAGAVFRDLGESGVVSTVRLTRVFRQRKNSLISINRERIRRGLRPYFHNTRLSRNDIEEINGYFAGDPMAADDIQRDVYLVPAGTPEHGAQRVLDCVLRWNSRGYDSVRDVMVLSPRRDGKMGTKNLNVLLQQALNPNGEPLRVGSVGKEAQVRDRDGLDLRVGDPVMQTKNEDQDAGIINGTRGVVHGVTPEGRILIDYGARGIRDYSRSDVREMQLAYAGTVHKAQGDQIPITVLALHESEHFINLKRSLLLVGATRSIEHMVYVATPRALHIALKNVDVRHTRLAERTRAEYERQKLEAHAPEDSKALLPRRLKAILDEAEKEEPSHEPNTRRTLRSGL